MDVVLLLDTDTVPAEDRAEAFQSAVSANCSTSMATFEDPDRLRAAVHLVDLGPAKVLTIDASGTTLRRTPRMARQMNECPIALALPLRASNQMLWDRENREFGPRDLILVDLSSPYVYRWPDDGASYAFHVDFDHLGLPMDTIRRATRDLRSSPLYPMVRDHIVRVTTEAHLVEGSTAREHVGAASAELMHALIVSAAGDVRRTRETLHTSATARVQAYVRQHLHDHELGPARVAAANGLSVRALYKLYEGLGTSLEQSIIDQRLQGAKADLVRPERSADAVAAVARAWGFTNPSHFSQRFRAAFGVTPRQWRREVLRSDTTDLAAV
ncbi:helix-turn-helix domain-containing protein [Actinomycetospora sp. CA-101289]|uniref:helix-turn-helix domain-containing protein n=1 Tax=Actinomycetospora sp. CA-101289 TaxID=3239893 RepID=UPI003D9896C7